MNVFIVGPLLLGIGFLTYLGMFFLVNDHRTGDASTVYHPLKVFRKFVIEVLMAEDE